MNIIKHLKGVVEQYVFNTFWYYYLGVYKWPAEEEKSQTYQKK